ncbi:hypothetical protein [Methylobacterium nodulans]|uniref:Uncharacterized protein n=1 Tax=Methylobacterium nodulans (strain LMG 21967 / CNCM I-2342 / ORS 2060) TaxID=460265 RepID=B8ITE7_METNO|nr:hypothetical protein [Methylobacterium nodulans]ACL57033.1 hypothetical protein Mnod_2047 [Methylobacterium nodulans ORS 2060]
MPEFPSQPLMPAHVWQLYGEIKACRDGEAIALIDRNGFKVWSRHDRDRAGTGSPCRRPRITPTARASGCSTTGW